MPSSPFSPVTAAGTPPAAARHEGVHALRGACVLAVFAYHVLNSRLPPPPAGEIDAVLRWLGGALRYGVEVFFMISGYVIVQSLRRHATVGAFLRDRALRIFPLWLPIALLLVAASTAAALATRAPLPAVWQSVPAFVGALLIVAPILPAPTLHPAQWSLAYELAFYGLAAWQGRVGRRHRLVAVAGVLAAAVLVTVFPRALFFTSGVVVALAQPWLAARAPRLRHAWLGLPVMLLAWLATGADEAGTDGRTLAAMAADGGGLGAAAVVLAWLGGTAFFAWVVVRLDRPLPATALARAAAWLGTVSYSFYLVHPLVMAAVKRSVVPASGLHGWAAAALFAAVSLPLAAVASHATWRLLEVGLRRRLKHLERPRPAARPAAVPRPSYPEPLERRP